MMVTESNHDRPADLLKWQPPNICWLDLRLPGTVLSDSD